MMPGSKSHKKTQGVMKKSHDAMRKRLFKTDADESDPNYKFYRKMILALPRIQELIKKKEIPPEYEMILDIRKNNKFGNICFLLTWGETTPFDIGEKKFNAGEIVIGINELAGVKKDHLDRIIEAARESVRDRIIKRKTELMKQHRIHEFKDVELHHMPSFNELIFMFFTIEERKKSLKMVFTNKCLGGGHEFIDSKLSERWSKYHNKYIDKFQLLTKETHKEYHKSEKSGREKLLALI